MTEPTRWRRREFLAGAAAAATAAACSPSHPSASSTPSTSSPSAPAPAASSTSPTFVSAGPRTIPRVALTFHVSGDPTRATNMLDLLHHRGVAVTAFMVGTFVDQHPELVARFVADGHEIANHTYTHLTFATLPRPQMESEVTKCRDALSRTAGTPGQFFRPSGTSNGTDPPSSNELDVITSAGYPTVVGFDVDPADYADPGADTVAARTVSALQPGSIVSLHFGHQGTIDALPGILDVLDARRLQPVTMSVLLAE